MSYAIIRMSVFTCSFLSVVGLVISGCIIPIQLHIDILFFGEGDSELS